LRIYKNPATLTAEESHDYSEVKVKRFGLLLKKSPKNRLFEQLSSADFDIRFSMLMLTAGWLFGPDFVNVLRK
jgi:hypothetical protein